jgi:hypothetical protein
MSRAYLCQAVARIFSGYPQGVKKGQVGFIEPMLGVPVTV